MKKILLALAALALSAATAVAQSTIYKIDPVHSSANFAVKHMMVSTVRGRFTDVSGEIVYNPREVWKSSVKAVIRVASINTDNAQRDAHLRTPDFFDAAKYAEITFVSTKVYQKGSQLYAIGNLTIHGVTRLVQLPFTLASGEVGGKKRLGVSSSIHIDRFDYGVSFDKTGTTVGRDVAIELDLEAAA